MKTIATYKYEANALYAASQLTRSGVVSEVMRTEGGFELRTEAGLNSTIEFLKALDLDESVVCSEEVDYAEGYVEWTENMYDPGHYTGGKTPHYLLDRSNWKFMILIFSMGILLFIVGLLKGNELDLGSLLWMGVYAVAVYGMLQQLRKRKKERRQ